MISWRRSTPRLVTWTGGRLGGKRKRMECDGAGVRGQPRPAPLRPPGLELRPLFTHKHP